jgi:uncharacterized protein YukE
MAQSSMWGADADALESLSRDMAAGANRLDAITRQLSARLTSSPWEGADSQEFRTQWNQRYRVQLRATADFLRHAQGRLSGSGEQQRVASRDDGPQASGPLAVPAPPGGLLSGLRNAWQGLRDGSSDWAAFTAPIVGLGVLTRAASTIGRYTNKWRPLANANDLFRYKSSPFLQGIKSLGGPVRQVLDNPAFRTVDKLAGKVNKVAGAVDLVGDLADITHGGKDGGDLARFGADVVATRLKASTNPVSYLAGVNVSIWSDVVETGVKAFESGDMTLRGLPSPFSRESFTNVYAPAAKDVASELGNMWKKWF